MVIKFKKLREDAIVPVKGSAAAAAYDLAIPSETPEFLVGPGDTVKIQMGFATELPMGTYAAVYPRSGMAIKRGLRLANSVAIIDADYRGEWIVAIHNDSEQDQWLKGGDRIAQTIISPMFGMMEFEETEELSDTERGEGGLGSTGDGTLGVRRNEGA